MNSFLVGDRVFAHEDIDCDVGIYEGMTGTIIIIDDDENEPLDCGVEWDDRDFCGHDLGGECNSNRGYWVKHGQLTLLNSDLEEFSGAEASELTAFFMG